MSRQWFKIKSLISIRFNDLTVQSFLTRDSLLRTSRINSIRIVISLYTSWLHSLRARSTLSCHTIVHQSHMFVETCVKLRLVEKSTRRSRRDWKSMNLEKFEQYFKTQLSKSLSKAKSERQIIDEYIESLLTIIERTMKNFIAWAKICDKSREFWSKECRQVVLKTRRKRRTYMRDSTMYNWTKYLHVCDKKDKIIKRHKRDDYREIIRLVDESNKRLYAIAKWIKNFVTTTNTKTTIS